MADQLPLSFDETTKQQRHAPMTTNAAILKVLNVDSEAEGIAQVNEFFRIMDKLKTATGARNTEEVVDVVTNWSGAIAELTNVAGAGTKANELASKFRNAAESSEKNRGAAGVLQKFENLTGKTGEEALGVVNAWKSSHEALPGVNAKLATLEKTADEAKLDGAFDVARKANKVTPTMEEKFRSQVASGEMSVACCISTLQNLEPVRAMATAVKQPSGGDGNPSGGLTYKGKTWDQMEPIEKHNLWAEDEDLYNTMRDAAQDDD